jgi:uncharacterized membrane protein YdfJ with MMPL/SSD domain
VPAVMHVFGTRNWWLPHWIDRRLPTLHIEADDLIVTERREEAVGAGSN